MRSRSALVLLALSVLILSACNGATVETDANDTVASESEPSEAASQDVSTSESETPAPTGVDEEALERVVQAAENTADEGTARFDLNVVTADTGAADGQQPVSVEAEEDFDAQQRALTFVGPDGNLDVVVDNTDVYVQIPATEDDDWARVQLEAFFASDVGFGGVGGLPFQSPQANLGVLDNAVTAAAEGGEEEVRGEPSTRYDLVVDLEAAAQNEDDTAPGLAAAVEQSGVTELDLQVWVDGEDRVNRIAYSLDLSQANTGALESELASEGVESDVQAEPTGRVTVDVEYYDFGADVTIEVPDDADVVDIDEDEILDSFGQ